MMEDLSWQQTQSTDPSSAEVATEEKQTDQTVGLVWSAEAETPVIRGWGGVSVNWKGRSDSPAQRATAPDLLPHLVSNTLLDVPSRDEASQTG